jgi:hypothetical protein
MIVGHGSTVRGYRNNHHKIESANHMKVCQYFSKVDESYRQVLSLLEMVIKNHLHCRKLYNTRSAHGHLLIGQLKSTDQSFSKRSWERVPPS